MIEKAKALLEAHPEAAVLDVRTEEEYVTGHLNGAILLPVDELSPERVQAALPDRDRAVLVYCRSGARSGRAAERLRALGYQVYDLGGLVGWPYELVSGWM